MEVLLIIVAGVLGFVWLARRGERIERTKDALREKAARDAFIAAPRASVDELLDAAMDNLSRLCVIHDRGRLREAMRSQVAEQTNAYRMAALRAASDVLATLPPDARLAAFTAALKRRISGELIDRLADESGEQIDNSAGLRAAMVKLAKRSVVSPDISWRDDGDYKGRLAHACPGCRRLFRDLASPSCEECGHVFEPHRVPASQT